MQLTPREQRALRAIEKALAAEDPALAELLTQWPERLRVRLRCWVRWAAVALAVILLLVGLVLSEAGLFFGALLLILVLVVIWRWVSPSARGGRRA